MEDNSEIVGPNQGTNNSSQPIQAPTAQAQDSGEKPILPSTTLVALLGVLLGPLGIHDFVIGKKKLGITHIIISAVAVLLEILSPQIIIALSAREGNVVTINPFAEMVLAQIPYYLNIANWIWAVVEVIIYSEKNHKKKVTNPIQPSSAIPPEASQYQKLSTNIRTTTKVASVSSIISIIINLIILLTAIFFRCEGSSCAGMGFILAFVILAGILPTFLSIVFSIYTAVLTFKLKKINNSDAPFRKSINITFILFAVVIATLVGIIIVWKIGVSQKSETSVTQELETARSTDMWLDSTSERTPYDTRQLTSYKDCYTYDEDLDYRAARDAICSYLMYAYLNNWQDAMSGDDFLNSVYTPGYLHGTDREELGENLVFLMADSGTKFELTRPKVYVVAPHENCNMIYDKNTISAWYLGYAPEMSSGQDYYCVAYSQPNGLYSSEVFEKSLQELKDHYKDEEYNFTATYNDGAIIYDNAKFLEEFFSNYDARLLD